ncbi:protein TPX2-like [Gastrolobium bilobum]|uniref:protein TPX2-like n=1 Tax=Gastrolobium bilobum TaxID=150636 RepID=UPI002AB2094D|nr:protein TPX2-like [Gastrolobium bilobum]
MTMMMVEEEDMEIENQVFVAHEIDLDYEFDAARFFDFSSQETPAQARQSEVWFETAGSYPPSPFVAKLVKREDGVSVSAFPEFENPECATSVNDAKSNLPFRSGNISGLLGGVHQDFATRPLQLTTGMTFSSKTISGNLNSKAKPAMMKGSTLMKPTASQLAKQNRAPRIFDSRFQKLQAHHKEMNLTTYSGTESQAAKRQKLEGGLLRKVGDVKQQANLVHKAPKKVVTVDQNSGHSKLKITIPREPELETAHRAQRIRPKNTAEAEHVTVAAPRFKAHPLNRKILNAPTLPLPKRSTPRMPDFQEFHLKTWERAMQHTSATSSSSLHCNDSDKVNLVHTIFSCKIDVSLHHRVLSMSFNIDRISLRETDAYCLQDLDKQKAVSATENRIRDLRRPSAMSAPKHDGLDFDNNFKARPLNKKILSSKGDIGVFWNRKQENTVPTEFNFHTEKRVQHNPPIELFNKLSLTSEVQSNDGSQLKLPRHSRVYRKDSKENIGSSVHLDRKEKPFIFGGKQIHSGIDGCITEASSTMLSARRSLGIR